MIPFRQLEMICIPSGEKAACEVVLDGHSRPLAPDTGFHTEIILSEQETICWPSGESATECAKLDNGISQTTVPDSASNTCKPSFFECNTSCLPLGEKVHEE